MKNEFFFTVFQKEPCIIRVIDTCDKMIMAECVWSLNIQPFGVCMFEINVFNFFHQLPYDNTSTFNIFDELQKIKLIYPEYFI